MSARGKTMGAATAALMALAGCNLAPTTPPPAMAVPTQYKALPGWAPATPSDAAPRGTWWTVFGDPDLNHLEQQLVSANPDLQAAIARYDAARGYAEEAKGALLPTLGLEGNALQNRQSEDRPLRGSNLPNNYGSDQVNAVAGYEVGPLGQAA